MKIVKMLCILLISLTNAHAQLVVNTTEPKITSKKAVVALHIKNGFNQKVESARATLFLLDTEGKMLGQSTQWVIGGGKDKPALPSGNEQTYNFVIPLRNSLASTNVQSRVSFDRIVLENGELANVTKDVTVQPSK